MSHGLNEPLLVYPSVLDYEGRKMKCSLKSLFQMQLNLSLRYLRGYTSFPPTLPPRKGDAGLTVSGQPQVPARL